MRSASRLTLLALTVLLLAGLLVPGLVSAHVRPAALTADDAGSAPIVDVRTVSIAPASRAPWPLWPLAAALAAAGLGLAILAPRRAFGVALVVLLAVFALETGVHSVHHLADQQAATQCVVSLAASHVHGASIEAPAVAPWVPIAIGAVVVAEPDRPGARSLRPDEGRAPPA